MTLQPGQRPSPSRTAGYAARIWKPVPYCRDSPCVRTEAREIKCQVTAPALGIKAVPGCFRLHSKTSVEFGNVECSRRKRLAGLQGLDLAHRNSCGKRPCQVPKLRSLRARLRRRRRNHCTPNSRQRHPRFCVAVPVTLPPTFGVGQNDSRGHCTEHRKFLTPRSLPSILPSPFPSIPPPPVRHDGSRWWRRPESPRGRTNAHLETNDGDCRRCATALPGKGRRGRRLRWIPRLRSRLTKPAPCKACFTQV